MIHLELAKPIMRDILGDCEERPLEVRSSKCYYCVNCVLRLMKIFSDSTFHPVDYVL